MELRHHKHAPHNTQAVVQVSLHGGSANKNIGDAFLLVWKFPDHARFPLAPVSSPGSRSSSLTSAINRKLFARRLVELLSLAALLCCGDSARGSDADLGCFGQP